VSDVPSYDNLLVDLDAGVATLTLNRPDRLNAWTEAMARDLSSALTWADEEDDVRVVVLTGAGRAFCAGADLGAGGSTFDARERRSDERPARLVTPNEIRKPVVAAINGHAIGVGITYPLLADVRYVAADAKVQFAFVRRGVLPELASSVVLPRVLGFSRAADLLLSGRMISGQEAADLGLASAALPADEVVPTAMAWARDVAVNAAPVSTAAAKRLLWADLVAPIGQSRRTEDAVFWQLGQLPDAAEGVQAFLERRPPSWKLSASRDLPDVTWPSASGS
jgi:enoyl-CoA hydratase/carnithine racemase